MPEPSIQNKNAMKMLFSTLVIVIIKTFFEAIKLTTPVFLALIGMYVLHLWTAAANVSFLNVRFEQTANEDAIYHNIMLTKVII